MIIVLRIHAIFLRIKHLKHSETVALRTNNFRMGKKLKEDKRRLKNAFSKTEFL